MTIGGPAGAWLDRGWYADAHGHRLSGNTLNRLLNRLLDRYTGTSPVWLTRLHDTFWVSYQPAGRYWVFQSVLGGGTLLVALLLGAGVIGLVRYRRA